MQLVRKPGHRLWRAYPEAPPQSRTWIGASLPLAVGVIVWGLIFWSAVFHRKKNTDPRPTPGTMPLEHQVLTVMPFLIISVLFFTVVVQEMMLQIAKDRVVIDITSFQWVEVWLSKGRASKRRH